jgi:hypothetical protein
MGEGIYFSGTGQSDKAQVIMQFTISLRSIQLFWRCYMSTHGWNKLYQAFHREKNAFKSYFQPFM